MESSISHAVEKNTRFCTTLNKVLNLLKTEFSNSESEQLVYTLVWVTKSYVRVRGIYTSSKLAN